MFDEFSGQIDSLPPPPLPHKHSDPALSKYTVLGAQFDGRRGDKEPFVPSLSQFGVEQLYDERAFKPSSFSSSSLSSSSSSSNTPITPKSELKRLSLELRSHVQLVARALAEEALGLGVTEEEKASASSVMSTVRLPLKEPKSFLLAKRCELIQLNMMHLLARLREVEAWRRLEKAAEAGKWTEEEETAVSAGIVAGGGAAASASAGGEAEALRLRAREKLEALVKEERVKQGKEKAGGNKTMAMMTS